MSSYTSIADYGLIGDGVTCALVSRTGSIDWFPVPHLESPGVFTAILDAERGGSFSISPSHASAASQAYAPLTNVLRTTFDTDAGSLTLTDFMPVDSDDPDTGDPDESPIGPDDADADGRAIYRKVECSTGAVDLDIEFAPRFDFARAETVLEAVEGGLVARAGGETLSLSTSAPVEWTVADVSGGPTATARTTLSAGETAWFVLNWGAAPDRPGTDGVGVDAGAGVSSSLSSPDPERSLDETRRYWREWAHDCGDRDCVFDGPWHDFTTRSGLVLKLLAHRESGAIAAAPTTSLPEEIGGVRNWDYRFSWLRDGAFTIQALSNLGHRAEARAFFEWFRGLCHTEPADLQPLYGLHGETDLDEEVLEHFSGYRGSAPVRVGNAARDQRQLDIYGELLVAAHETTATAAGISPKPTGRRSVAWSNTSGRCGTNPMRGSGRSAANPSSSSSRR